MVFLPSKASIGIVLYRISYVVHVANDMLWGPYLLELSLQILIPREPWLHFNPHVYILQASQRAEQGQVRQSRAGQGWAGLGDALVGR